MVFAVQISISIYKLSSCIGSYGNTHPNVSSTKFYCFLSLPYIVLFVQYFSYIFLRSFISLTYQIFNSILHTSLIITVNYFPASEVRCRFSHFDLQSDGICLITVFLHTQNLFLHITLGTISQETSLLRLHSIFTSLAVNLTIFISSLLSDF